MKTRSTVLFLFVGSFSTETFAFQPRGFAKRPFSPFSLKAEATQESEGSHTINIEYCTGCRWMLKSFWMAQELLTTFENELDAVTVLPSSEKGIFSVSLDGNNLLWDRKVNGGFPSPKGLKQLVRDMVEPEKFLGHSDTEERQSLVEGTSKNVPSETTSLVRDMEQIPSMILDVPEPAITITYCTGCRWLLRAAYIGQELLTTFNDDLKSVTLVPSKPPAKGGIFSIALNGEMIFDRGTEGRFPEVKEIKQMVRDRVIPDKDLGHSDIDQNQSDEEDAADARRFFGVD